MTDIPLVPSLHGQAKSGTGLPTGTNDDKTKHNFVLHWLNNKEMEFTGDFFLLFSLNYFDSVEI